MICCCSAFKTERRLLAVLPPLHTNTVEFEDTSDALEETNKSVLFEPEPRPNQAPRQQGSAVGAHCLCSSPHKECMGPAHSSVSACPAKADGVHGSAAPAGQLQGPCRIR